ncbi:hypothetical protein [Lentibacillus saliphilus]|uniref:hypothetical protein n=1 Tax=Lentibacillus saliphilus TaxID=2737028 RepID=UPI001C305DB9|nr:hypothetical protein [Lentibacillus saliphilus]
MHINKIKVRGELELEQEFGRFNVILGENKTGKSTLMNLIIYALGTRVENFIDEIKYGRCKQVELDVKCKSGRKFKFIRSLPKSEIITVIPLDENNREVDDGILVFDLPEFSDYILTEEGYSVHQIPYGSNKNAALRIYFLLRAIFVDQNTNAAQIFANLGGDNNYYINNQKLIKKAIIEEFLGKENHSLQKLRVELQSLLKDRNEENAKLKIINEIIDKDIDEFDFLKKNLKSMETELLTIQNQKEELSHAKSEKLLELNSVNDDHIQNEILHLGNTKEVTSEKLLELKLELFDTKDIIKNLNNEVDKYKKMIVARQLITKIPVDSCPICLTDIDVNIFSKKEDDTCPFCNNTNSNDQIYENIGYFRMLNESKIEAEKLEGEIGEEIKILNEKLKIINNQTKKLRNEELKQNNETKNAIEEIINNIKQRYEYLIFMEEKYKIFIKNLKQSNSIKDRKKELTVDISEVRENLTELESDNSTAEISKIEKWEELLFNTLGYIYKDVDDVRLNNNFLPIVDNTEISKVSSASFKVATRLAYVLSLLKLQDYKNINHLGFVLFDSPKDKDLDSDKYYRFLEKVKNLKTGQVILSGSSKEKGLYESLFSNDEIILDLEEGSKLLQKKATL